MNYALQALSSNGIAVVLLCSLFLNYRKRYTSEKAEHRVFRWMLFINLLQCTIETATIAIDGLQFHGAIALATALNAALFFNNIVFALLWSVYADVRVHNLWMKRPKLYFLKFIPAILVALGALVNLFVPVYFRISDDNIYSRTALFLIPYIATYFYLILGSAIVYSQRARQKQYVFVPAFTFLFPVVLASIVQFFVAGISLLWVGAAIGLNSAYISLLDESSSVDPLSQVYSRHYLNQQMNNLPKQYGDNRHLAGILLDIDRFKSINDQFGHLTGDDAIRNVGRLLRRAVPLTGTVFRYAGDEFVVLLPILRESEIGQVLSNIQEAVDQFNTPRQKPYQLQFSIGYTVYHAGESIQAFFGRMDEAMYKEKKRKQEEN